VGTLGYDTTLITSRKAFYISFQLPQVMVLGDQLYIPVLAFNTLANTTINASLSIVDHSSDQISAKLDFSSNN